MSASRSLLASDPGPRRSPGGCPRGSGPAKKPTRYAGRERISRRAAIDNCCGVGRKLEPSAGPRYRATEHREESALRRLAHVTGFSDQPT